MPIAIDNTSRPAAQRNVAAALRPHLSAACHHADFGDRRGGSGSGVSRAHHFQFSIGACFITIFVLAAATVTYYTIERPGRELLRGRKAAFK